MIAKQGPGPPPPAMRPLHPGNRQAFPVGDTQFRELGGDQAGGFDFAEPGFRVMEDLAGHADEVGFALVDDGAGPLFQFRPGKHSLFLRRKGLLPGQGA